MAYLASFFFDGIIYNTYTGKENWESVEEHQAPRNLSNFTCKIYTYSFYQNSDFLKMRGYTSDEQPYDHGLFSCVHIFPFPIYIHPLIPQSPLPYAANSSGVHFWTNWWGPLMWWGTSDFTPQRLPVCWRGRRRRVVRMYGCSDVRVCVRELPVLRVINHDAMTALCSLLNTSQPQWGLP